MLGRATGIRRDARGGALALALGLAVVAPAEAQGPGEAEPAREAAGPADDTEPPAGVGTSPEQAVEAPPGPWQRGVVKVEPWVLILLTVAVAGGAAAALVARIALGRR
ncbi:MAG: hypothetical protein ACFCGT_20830 [Sandaracinaceae bacterium]